MAGGVVVWLLPACIRNSSSEGNGVTQNPFPVSDGQLALLAEMVDTVIPENGTPGAKALNVHHFVVAMVQNCRPDDYIEKFMAGLDELESYSAEKNRKTFSASGFPERLSLLKGVSKDGNVSAGIKTLVSGVRELTIRGYSNSQYVMTGPVPYELVPGHFRGCVNATKITS